eukprot:m.251972 g.251972  ORF g.251972 m.251972 type:complete len:185 (-) comp17505_c0_seq1:48-602(-)
MTEPLPVAACSPAPSALEIRELTLADAVCAADIMHDASAVMPGCDPSLHTRDEAREYWRDHVLPSGPAWGAWCEGKLVGTLATSPGWIDHVHVLPAMHRRGIATALLRHAQQHGTTWRLFTFLINTPARVCYERVGFCVEETTDGERNEEKLPDVTYVWHAAAAADAAHASSTASGASSLATEP